MPTAFPPSSPGPAPPGLHKMPSNSTMQIDDDESMTFESSSEEAAYYRDKYRRVADFLEETRAELDEFQSSSKELEDELEKELLATEKQQAELKDRIKRLEAEKEEWKAKHISAQKMHSSTVSAMQREMDNLRSEGAKALVALRDLEMGNDELERNERVAVSSLLDLESKYNRAIEEKTLLEQELVQKTEVEEDSQRLKDDLRDANDQIQILRDQLARSALPTPPSSISVPLSPSRSAVGLPDLEGDTTPTIETPSSPSRTTFAPPVKTTLSRSSSGIPTISPTLRRATTQIPGTPQTGMVRSHTARNLTPGGIANSPSLARSRSGLAQPSPMRAPTEAKYPLSRAAKMVTDLRRRIKATDDRMGGKATRRAVSNPTSEVLAPAPKSGIAGPTKPVNPRLATLSNDQVSTPVASSTSSILSPNGWILVDDASDPDQTPPANGRYDPSSPLEHMQIQHPRAVSNASTATTSRGLPSRPGIPSPLMTLAASRQVAGGGTPTPQSSTLPMTSSGLAKSTLPPSGTTRPPSRSALSQSTRAPSRAETSRPPSRNALAASTKVPPISSRSVSRAGASRPMSPGMMSPSASRSTGARSPGPNSLSSLTASVSTTSTRPSAPGRAMTSSTLGRGPPPSALASNTARRQLSMSVSTTTPPSRLPAPSSYGSAAATDLRRRRSSMGPGKEVLADKEGYFSPAKPGPAGYTTPVKPTIGGLGHSTGPGGKGRPVSVPHFGTPPPDVPRIPSVHLREKRRTLQQS